MSVYLDFNSSAPIDNRVLDYMIDVYRTSYGNADSRTHTFGDSARQIVESARKQVASILAIKSDEVFFTSGATESNNIAIQGLRDYAVQSGKRHIITSTIEHKAVLETVKHLEKEGFEVTWINPETDGRIPSQKIKSAVRDDTLLVSLMHVNNETGIIQPVQEIGEFCSEKKVLFHIDATQSFGKLINELREAKYDMLSMSAHKICGPQGVGALILRKKRYKIPPVKGIMFGGQQEHGIRPGTIPVALVAGLGKACEIAENEFLQQKEKCIQIKEQLFKLLEESGIGYKVNGSPEYCIFTTLNISFTGVSSEALMLSTKQFCGVSNGAACNSNSYAPSYVLTAMGIPTDQIESAIRVSWGNQAEIDEVIHGFKNLLYVAKKLS